MNRLSLPILCAFVSISLAQPAKPVPNLSTQPQPKQPENVSAVERPAAPPVKPAVRSASANAAAPKTFNSPLIPRCPPRLSR